MADSSSFLIDGQDYPVPTSFRLTDPILVEELTGLSFQEFSERIDDMNAQIAAGGDSKPDYAVTLGLVGVAVWQQHEDWPRRKVREYLTLLDVQALEVVAPEAPADPTGGPKQKSTPSSGRSKTVGGDTSSESTSTPEPLPDGALV